MLLNPDDFEYEYFHQPRGREGDSGAIYFGKPFDPEQPLLSHPDSFETRFIRERQSANFDESMADAS